MKKVCWLLLLVGLLVMSTGVLAADWEFVGGLSQNSLNFDGKVVYDSGEYVDDVDLSLGTLSGFGINAGGRYWFNDKLGLGLGFDWVTAEGFVNFDITETEGDYSFHDWVDAEATNNLSGFYGELVYKLNNMINLTGGIGYYDYSLDVFAQYGSEYTYPDSYAEAAVVDTYTSDPFDETILEASGMGYTLGAEMKYPIKENIAIVAGAAFRTVNLDVDKVFDGETLIDVADIEGLDEASIDICGLKASLGVSVDF